MAMNHFCVLLSRVFKNGPGFFPASVAIWEVLGGNVSFFRGFPLLAPNDGECSLNEEYDDEPSLKEK